MGGGYEATGKGGDRGEPKREEKNDMTKNAQKERFCLDMNEHELTDDDLNVVISRTNERISKLMNECTHYLPTQKATFL